MNRNKKPSYFSIRTRLKIRKLKRQIRNNIEGTVWNEDHTACLIKNTIKDYIFAYTIYNYKEFDENNNCIYEVTYGDNTPILQNWYIYDNENNLKFIQSGNI